VRRTTFRRLKLVAGVDISIRNEQARAAIVVLRWPELEPVEQATAVRPVEFPYVPGLLAFREMPSILDAFGRLKKRPDLLLADGQGLAHPRRFGIACHLGVELDLPSIGCGKSRLIGEHREPADRRGTRAALRDKGEIIGSVVRTRAGVKPVYVSIGHRIDLAAAVRIVLRSCTKYRLPEPVRCAHRAAGAI
jgi:deoxyribonuclease V